MQARLRISIILLITILLPWTNSLAQVETFANAREGKNIFLINRTPPTAALQGGALKPTSLAATRAFIAQTAKLLSLQHTYELRLKEQTLDQQGITHLRFVQHKHGIPVFGAEAIAHVDSNAYVTTLSSHIVSQTPLFPSPKLTRGEAKRRALKYFFELHKPERTPSILRNELVYFNLGLIRQESETTSVLTFLVQLYDGVYNDQLFIAADTGKLVHRISKSHDISRKVGDCSLGTGFCYYGLQDPSFPSYTLGRVEGAPARGPNPRTGTADTDLLYDYIGSAHDYYTSRHGRNGANNQGGLGDGPTIATADSVVLSFLDFVSDSCPNAWWDGVKLNFCKDLVVLDIAGHEYTHAVTSYSADLVYENESGALNEGFSDIFGEAVENYINGSSDWVTGAGSGLGALRSLSDPSSKNSGLGTPFPNRFHSENFYCGQADYGGVHHNSSVFNYAAYLIAEGGNFNGCSITGIGREKQEQIFYRALTNYLGSTSGFNAAYNSLNTACRDLYSAEDCWEVTKALRAVELDQAGACSGQSARAPVCGDIETTPPEVETPTPAPSDTDNIGQIDIRKRLRRTGKRKSTYLLLGIVANSEGTPLGSKNLIIQCDFNGLAQSLDVTSNELGLFGARVIVGKRSIANCEAWGGYILSNRVRFKYRRPK